MFIAFSFNLLYHRKCQITDASISETGQREIQVKESAARGSRWIRRLRTLCPAPDRVRRYHSPDFPAEERV